MKNCKQTRSFAFNHSTDIGFKDFKNLYKECIAKPYSFLVIDTTFAAHNTFRKNVKN